MDGTDESSRGVRQAWSLLKGSGVELVALHVFDPDSTPPFWDATRDDLEAWSREFVARHTQTETELEVRTGSPAENVMNVGQAAKVDLLVLVWSQDLRPGRAAVVREVLSHTDIPVLLLPLAD